ncbi:hypothetical protein TorRG33x02_338750, partial [Trema orientale]
LKKKLYTTFLAAATFSSRSSPPHHHHHFTCSLPTIVHNRSESSNTTAAYFQAFNTVLVASLHQTATNLLPLVLESLRVTFFHIFTLSMVLLVGKLINMCFDPC